MEDVEAAQVVGCSCSPAVEVASLAAPDSSVVVVADVEPVWPLLKQVLEQSWLKLPFGRHGRRSWH